MKLMLERFFFFLVLERLNGEFIHSFLRLQDNKDIEVQFSIGDALVSAALGVNSPDSRDVWTVKEEDFVELADAPSDLGFVLDELLEKYVPHLHPNVKQVIDIITDLI